MTENRITHCLTIGRRPDLLRQTLESLAKLHAIPTLAINDFGDTETSVVFTQICPNGRIVGPGHHLGHHRAIDAMYSHVETPFIFHGEDDWRFTRTDFLPAAITLLEAEPRISMVCLRASEDMQLSAEDSGKIVTEERDGIAFERLDALHDQWHGFTFNPHLTRKALWERLGGYARFEKERHLSRYLRANNQFVAFLRPAACYHIGEGRSSTWKPSRFRQFKAWLRGEKARS